MMRTGFNPKADAFYARFAPEGTAIDRTQEVAPGVMIDLDAAGNLVGVEVLNVTQRELQPVPEVSMERETTTPGRGSPESAAWFRDKLAKLGLSRGALARFMLAHGDDRQPATILRTLRRMANGEARVSGEMRALLGTLEQARRSPG